MLKASQPNLELSHRFCRTETRSLTARTYDDKIRITAILGLMYFRQRAYPTPETAIKFFFQPSR